MSAFFGLEKLKRIFTSDVLVPELGLFPQDSTQYHVFAWRTQLPSNSGFEPLTVSWQLNRFVMPACCANISERLSVNPFFHGDISIDGHCQRYIKWEIAW